MDLADLRVFKAVVDEGGVIKAARRLHRVPSGITTRIRRLEEAMGVALFLREQQRLHLSSAGVRLLDYANRIIKLSEEARSVVSGMAPSGILKVGALESTSASRLPSILVEFHRSYPDVRLELVTGTNDDLTSKVAERQIDAAFTAEPPSLRTLDYIPVFSERLVVISHPDHPRIRSRRDIEGASLVVFPDGCAYRRVFSRWLGTKGFGGLRILELSSYHAIVACVASGAGIALVPESVLNTMPKTPVLRHAIPEAQAKIITPLIWLKGDISPAILALRGLTLSRPQRR